MSIIPGAFNYIQQESLQFNNPVSESSLNAMGASINGILSVLLPVGSILDSMLTEIQFQAQLGNPNPATWIIADGRGVSGSSYQTATGSSSVPDLRGIFSRSKNNGRSGSSGNPDGDLALGTYTADKFASHNHALTDPGHNHSPSTGGNQFVTWQNASDGAVAAFQFGGIFAPLTNLTSTSGTGITLADTGGNETAPRNVTVNRFIRIN